MEDLLSSSEYGGVLAFDCAVSPPHCRSKRSRLHLSRELPHLRKTASEHQGSSHDMNVAPFSIPVGGKNRWEALTWTADKTKVSIGTYKEFAVGVLSQKLRAMFRMEKLVIDWGSHGSRS